MSDRRYNRDNSSYHNSNYRSDRSDSANSRMSSSNGDRDRSFNRSYGNRREDEYRGNRPDYRDNGNPYRSNGGYRDNDYRGGRGDTYRGNGCADYRGGSFRGGRGGGAGNGRARDDDSSLCNLPSRELDLFPIEQLPSVVVSCSSKDMVIQTNGYEIDSSRANTAYQYDIRWKGMTKRGKELDLNHQTKDDVKLQLKQHALRSIFYQLLRAHPGFFKLDGGGFEKYVYDSGSMFFYPDKILNDDETRSLEITADSFEQVAKDYYKNFVTVTAEIKCSREINPSVLNGDLENDRPALQYLELAFSQRQRSSGDVLCFGNKFYDKLNSEPVEQTPLVLKNGVSRSIRIIGEPKDNKLMVQVVPTKATFYGDESLRNVIEYAIRDGIDSVFRGSNLKIASEAVKGLCVRTTHLENNRLLIIHGVSSRSALETTFTFDDNETNVADYYLNKYRIRLRYPHLPCAVEKKGKDKFYHPLELLRIPENQRIPKVKQSNDLNSKIIRKCQILPHANIIQIEQQREGADIMNSNEFIKQTGVRVDARQLVTAPANIFVPPAVIFKDNQKTLKSGIFGMQGVKFLRAAKVKRLAFVIATRDVDASQANQFCQQLLQRLKLYGVEIKEHDFMKWDRPDRDFDSLLDLARREFDFAFIIGDSDQLHHGMKHMELNTRLVTQNVKPQTVKKANNSLFDNLALKFNLKAGGLNWNIGTDPSISTQLQEHDLLQSLLHDTLFFGIDLSHPAGGVPKNADSLDPTCVGFASNIFGGEANMEKGDFGYQAPRNAIVQDSLLADKFKNAVMAYYRNSGKSPKWIVVYRAGLSEGEIQKIRVYEIPVLQHSMDLLKQNCPGIGEAKLTFIMSNRITPYRIFKDRINVGDRAPLQNVPAGTCVADKIVTRQFPSFILVSQKALIGTARPTVYYILEGADVVPIEMIRWMTNSLCYAHGIVTSPTALPSPLVSAADLSKRARNNYKQQKYGGGDDVQSHSSDGSARHREAQGDVLTDDEKKEMQEQENGRYDEITRSLKSGIEDRRFWA